MRRLPWVTFTVMGVCLLALLLTNGAASETEEAYEQAQERILHALEGWGEHPYLTIDERALAALPSEARSQYEEAHEKSPPAELPSDEIAEQQAKLDQEIADALAQIDAARAKDPYRAWGLVPGAIGLRGLFTHMFMHAGWMHLLGNLFMLFIAGPALEDRWGRPLYAAFFVVSGLASGLFFAALARDPNIPLVGASGAIAGVFGAFLVRLWSTQIRFWYLLWLGLRFIQGTFESPAWVMLPLWFANELFQAWLGSVLGTSGGVANEAHIGGFLFGAAMALGVKASRYEERVVDAAIESKITVHGNAAVAAALGLREAGDLAGALRQLEAEVQRQPRDADAVDAYWDAARASGCAGDAAPAVVALAQRELSTNQMERAAQRFAEVHAALPDYGFDPAFVVRLAPQLRATDHELALRALRWLAAKDRGPLSPTLAQRAVEEARALDAQVAKHLARRFATAELPEPQRARFAALARELEAEAPDRPEQPPSGLELADEASAEGAFRDFSGDELGERPSEAAESPSLELASAPTAEAAPELTSERDFDAGGFSPGDLDAAASAEASDELVSDSDLEALAPLLDESAATPALPRFASLKVTEATPLALTDGALQIALDGGRKGRLALAKVDGVALAAVRGLAAKPVLLLDLLVGYRAVDGGELRCVRMRSDRFDPRRLISGEPDALAALRAFVAQLVETSGAAALAAADPARANDLTPFTDLTTYEREVLEVGA